MLLMYVIMCCTLIQSDWLILGTESIFRLPSSEIETDANANVGSDNTVWEGTLGNEQLGNMNTENGLVKGGTFFQHKDTTNTRGHPQMTLTGI